MDDCCSLKPGGRGKLILNHSHAQLGDFPLPSNLTVQEVFCDEGTFWCFEDIRVPAGNPSPIKVVSWDLARRASNHEVGILGERNFFAYDELFPLLVAECHYAKRRGESDVLLMNDGENIFPVIYDGREAELLCALDRNVWTVAMRNYPSTAYDSGDRIFRPG